MANAISKPKQEAGTPTVESTYQAAYMPRIDIWESEDELVLYGDLPGVAPEDLDIRFEERELTVHGRVRPRHEGKRFVEGEYGLGDFHRTFTIGEAIDVDKISAEMRDGVLILHLPKSEKLKPRRIEVRSS